MGKPVTLAVIDDQDVVLAGVQSWIAEDAGRRVKIIYTAPTPHWLDRPPADVADVLVIDLQINGELVFGRIAELTAAGRRVVVFSQYADVDLVRRAETAGARAYIAKGIGEGRLHLIEAVLAVAAGGTYTTPSEAGVMLAAASSCQPRFSEQELRAMRLWLGGLTRAAVARQMGISEHTVKQYLDRAREKYAKAGRRASTRLDLYREARRDGIVEP